MVNYQDAVLDRTFSALADPTRRALLARLDQEQELTVSELARPFTMSMPLTPLDGGTILPYECHEGNYGLPNAMSAERAEDKAIAEDLKNGITRARRTIQVPVPNRPAAPAEEN